MPSTQASLSPGILSLLPMFYVAWSDGILSPTEMSMIHSKIHQYDFLTDDDRAYLISWTDPSRSPSKAIFAQWIREITRHGAQLPESDRHGLAQLGWEIATKISDGSNKQKWMSEATRSSLLEMEKILGVEHDDSSALILNRFRTDREHYQRDPASQIDTKALHEFLEGDGKVMRDRLRALLSDPSFSTEYRATKKEYRDWALEKCQVLADQGYGLLALPEYVGGQDNMTDYASVFELLAHYDGSLTIKFGVQFGLFALSILNLGTREQHEKYLHRAGTLALKGCFAMTETGHGSNVRGLETTATYDKESDSFIIHTPRRQAGKEYIGNALHGEAAVVFAQLIVAGESHGVHALYVDLVDADGNDLPGIQREDCGYKMGLNGVDNGRLYFDQVAVPRDQLLSRFGRVSDDGTYHSDIENPNKRFFVMLGTLVGGRICVASAGLAMAKNALHIATAYAHKRRQFGPSDDEPETLLIDYPSHQMRLIPRIAEAYGIGFALTDLSARYMDDAEKNKKIESLAAGLKARATWFATSTIQECREACGGAGYIWENGISQLKADSDIFTTFEGDNTVLIQLVAKGLLSDFSREFHDEGFRAVFRRLMQQANTSITEKNLLNVRKTDAAHLLDPVFHREALRFREKHLLHTVALRMRRYIKQKLSSTDAFLRCQNHMIALAHAYVDRVILKAYHKALETCPMEIQPTLRHCAEIYALDMISRHKDYYLEHGYMEGSKTKAVRRILRQRIQSLKGSSLALVEAWGIPHSCLQSELVQ